MTLSPTEVVRYLDSDPMHCFLCGDDSRGYQQLGRHLSMKHGVTSREYCSEFGIPFRFKGATGLCTRTERARMSRVLLNIPGLVERVAEIHKLSSTTANKKGFGIGPGDDYNRVALGLSKTRPKKCLWCRKVFRPWHGEQEHCSRSCGGKTRYKRHPRPIQPPKPCVECGEPYKPLRRGMCGRCYQRWRAR